MPNPKVGTVTFEVGKTVKEMKAGRVEFRVGCRGNLYSRKWKNQLREREDIRESERTYLLSKLGKKLAACKQGDICEGYRHFNKP